MIKKIIKIILNRLGYGLVLLDKSIGVDDFYSKHSHINKEIIDVDKLGKMSLTIPGMITPVAGKFLFTLCYMQEMSGDVVEIGSWQGRSSSFLARAVKESKNGNFYAIDHFKGNEGKEQLYAVDGKLSSLKANFKTNMKAFGLSDMVNLLDMINYEAAKKIENHTIRFLFIDGDHTKHGVSKDIELFFPMLKKGSIVVFDDYFEGFPGLIEAVDKAMVKYNFDRIFYHTHTLVVKI